MLFPIILFSAVCAVMIFLGFRPTSRKSPPDNSAK
jgi:hypothetical protein